MQLNIIICILTHAICNIYTNRNVIPDCIVIGGDYNAKIEKKPIEDIMGQSGEMYSNYNIQTLRNLASYRIFRFLNLFFKPTFLWSSQWFTIIIDCFLSNRRTFVLFTDVRVYWGYYVNTDRFFLLVKVVLKNTLA